MKNKKYLLLAITIVLLISIPVVYGSINGYNSVIMLGKTLIKFMDDVDFMNYSLTNISGLCINGDCRTAWAFEGEEYDPYYFSNPYNYVNTSGAYNSSYEYWENSTLTDLCYNSSYLTSFTESDPRWSANYTAFNSSWSSRYNSSYEYWSNSTLTDLCYNSSYLTGFTEADPAWYANYTAFNSSWSSRYNATYDAKQDDIGSNCASNNYAYGVEDDGTLLCREDQSGSGGSATPRLIGKVSQSKTMSNIGNPDKQIYSSGFDQEWVQFNTTGFSYFKIIYGWSYIGSGTQGIKWNSTAGTLYSITKTNSCDPCDSGWIAIPAGYTNTAYYLVMYGNSTTAMDDPVSYGYEVSLL